MKWLTRWRADRAELRKERRTLFEANCRLVNEAYFHKHRADKLAAEADVLHFDPFAEFAEFLRDVDAIPVPDKETRNAAYRRVFDTPDGRIILRDMARACHVLNPTIASPGGATDIGMTGFQEGQRWAFQRTWRLSQSAPDAQGSNQ